MSKIKSSKHVSEFTMKVLCPIMIVLILAFGIACDGGGGGGGGGDDGGGGDNPTPPSPETISGQLSLPSGSNLSPSDLLISAGIHGSYNPTSDGSYTITLQEGAAPVLAIATSPSGNPMLLNILVPDNFRQSSVRRNLMQPEMRSSSPQNLNTQTTAASMVFFALGLYCDEPDNFDELLQILSNVSEVQTLASVLDNKLVSNPDILAQDPPDNDILIALQNAIGPSQIAIENAGLVTMRSSSETHSGLTIDCDDNGHTTATNSKLRFVGVVTNGPNVNDVWTLVSPCKPLFYIPSLAPTTTTIIPDPLPTQGATYTLRASGGFDNSNGLYTSGDSDSWSNAVCHSATYDVVIPLINIILGTTSPVGADVVQLSFDLLDIFETPTVNYISSIKYYIDNDILQQNLWYGTCIYSKDIFDAVLSYGIGNFSQILVAYFTSSTIQIALSNSATPFAAVLRIVSTVSNGSTMGVGIYSLCTTSMVDQFEVSLSTPYVWITNSDANTVTKLDSSNGSTIGIYNVGGGPSGVAVDASGNVWVANQSSNTVTKLNGSNGSTIGTYSVGREPQGIAVDASGNVWVANHSDKTVTKLNGSNGSTIGTYYVVENPEDLEDPDYPEEGLVEPTGVAVDASGNVWVANCSTRTVTKLNGSNGNIIGIYGPADSGFLGIAVDASGNVWATNFGPVCKVTKLNGSNVSIIGTYSVGEFPWGVAVDASGNVWVANYYGHTVTKLNGSNGSIIGTYSVGEFPCGIAVDASGNVWVANSGDGTVTKLNGSDGSVIGTYSAKSGYPSIGDMTGFALQYFVLRRR